MSLYSTPTVLIIAAATRVANASTQPPLIPASDPIFLLGPGMTIPKRRGRPPKEKKQSPRPKILTGANSRKRNFSSAHSSSANHATPTSRQNQTNSSNVGSIPTTSNGRLVMKSVPASVKPQKDFHTQDPPLP